MRSRALRQYSELSLAEVSKNLPVFAEAIRKAVEAYTRQRRFQVLEIKAKEMSIGDLTALVYENLKNLIQKFDPRLQIDLMPPFDSRFRSYIELNPPAQFENLECYLLAVIAYFFSQKTPADLGTEADSLIELFFAGLQKLTLEALPAADSVAATDALSVTAPAAGGAGAGAGAAAAVRFDRDGIASAEKSGGEFEVAPLAQLMLLQLSQAQNVILSENADLLAAEMTRFKSTQYSLLVEQFNQRLIGAVHFAVSANPSIVSVAPVAYAAAKLPPLMQLLRAEMTKVGLSLATAEGLACFTTHFSTDGHASLSLEFGVLSDLISSLINDPTTVLEASSAASSLKDRYQKLIQLLARLKLSPNKQLAAAAEIYYEAFAKLPYFEDPAAIPSLEEVQAEFIYRYRLRDSNIAAALARSTSPAAGGAGASVAAPAPVPSAAELVVSESSQRTRLKEIETALTRLRFDYGQATAAAEAKLGNACWTADFDYEQLRIEGTASGAAEAQRDQKIKEANECFAEEQRQAHQIYSISSQVLLEEQAAIQDKLKGSVVVAAIGRELRPVEVLFIKPNIGELIKELFERNFKALQKRFVAQYCAYRDQARLAAAADSSITPELDALIARLAENLGLDKAQLSVQVQGLLQQLKAQALAGDGRAMISLSFKMPTSAVAASELVPAAAAPTGFFGLLGWGGATVGAQVTRVGAVVEVNLGLDTVSAPGAVAALAASSAAGGASASALVPVAKGGRGFFAGLFGGGAPAAVSAATVANAGAGAAKPVL